MLISCISAVSGIIVTFITVRYKKQAIKPKDRVDTAFDMYEALIRQLNGEIERKDAIITKQAIEISKLSNKE